MEARWNYLTHLLHAIAESFAHPIIRALLQYSSICFKSLNVLRPKIGILYLPISTTDRILIVVRQLTLQP